MKFRDVLKKHALLNLKWYQALMFQKIFDARVQDLWQLYEATGEMNHPGEKGLLREVFLKQLLMSILPPHFGIGGGVVVDKWSRQSPQVDIVIFDRRRMPPIFEQGAHGIYPVDSVLRVIEVKSTLNREALVQLKKLIWAFHPKNPGGLKIADDGTLEGGQAYYAFPALFAYTTEVINVTDMLSEIGGFENESAPICVIKHGNINDRSAEFRNLEPVINFGGRRRIA